MKKTIKIRIISLVISLSIIFSMLPISAMAVVDGVAVIGGNGYDTLQAAFNAVTDGQTIKLLSNIYITNTVTISEAEGNGKNFTLDLNGYTIDSGNESAISHNGYGKMTITDSSVSGDGKITSSNNTNSNAIRGTIRFVQNGSLVITGGTVEHTGEYGDAIFNDSEGTLEVLGGVVQSMGAKGTAIYINSSSSLSISAAKVNSKGTSIYYFGTGKISIINNAEIISENSTTISIYGSSYGTEYTALEINSGVVKSTSANSGAINTNSSGKIVISGSAKVMSNNTGSGVGTISLFGGSILEINGGRVEDTGTGKAIYSSGSAKITVCGNAFVSSSANYGSGTIDLSLSYGSILKITDGVVENTSLYGAAIYNRDGSAAVEISGGTVQSKEGYAIYSVNNFSSSTDGKALISNGVSVIKGGISAMYEAPILNDTEYYITGSKTDVNGEDASQLLKTDIQTYEQIRAYKYLKFEPTISVLTGTAIITNTAPRIGDVLSGSVKNSNNIGALTYTWKADGTQIGSEKDYTVTVNELGKTISLEIKSSIETGIIKSDDTETVRKKSAPIAPEAPSIVSKTHNIVTLTANVVYEFSKDKSTWQLSNVFSGLNESTSYTFYQRIASTSDTEESEASEGFNIITNSNTSNVGNDYEDIDDTIDFNTDHSPKVDSDNKEPSIAFIDIANHWAKEDIEFVVNRGLFAGISTETFGPNIEMTRGMFVTVLGRMANADVSSYKKSNFIDVKIDTYYMGYVEWANKSGIVNGIGNEKFAPELAVTREQIAFMLQNYAEFIGLELSKIHGENTFVDSIKISGYAKDAVKLMQMSGIINGKDENIFAPQVAATRAEVSSLLHRFIELISSHNMTQEFNYMP